MKLKTTKERAPLKTPFFYGWIVVLISGLGFFFSGPGQTHSVSVFIDSYINEFGWSRSFVSSLYSAGTLVAGFVLSIIGKQIDKRGHRVMVPIISIFFAIACLWMSIVFNPLMLLFGFFLIRLLGQGSMTLSSATLPPQWFEKKRGRALSIMSLGGVLGAALLPPINTWLIQTWGWRSGWQVWAVLLVIVMAPLAYFFIRNRPEDIGLSPDNEKNTHDNDKDTSNSLKLSWTLAEAKSTRVFWLLLFCMFVPSMVNTGLTFHMVSIIGEKGLSAVVAASVLSVIAIVALPCSLLAGYVVDRFKINIIIVITFVGQVLAILILLYTHSFTAAMVFAVLRGVVQGFEGISFNAIWPTYFGRHHLGSIRGFAMTTMVLGSSLGPLPFGVFYDIFGGYSQILWLMLGFPLLAIFASWMSVPPVK